MKEHEILLDLERMTTGWDVPPEWRKLDGKESSQEQKQQEEDAENHD